MDVCVQTAVEAVASGGKVVLVGMGQDKCTLNTGTTLVKELDLHGCFRCACLDLKTTLVAIVTRLLCCCWDQAQLLQSKQAAGNM